MQPPHGQGPGQQPYPPQQPAPSPGFQSAAAKKRAKRAESGGGALELLLDKSIDFALIFVGLYAATALQRCQDTAKEKQEYVSLLKDFKRELDANIEQEASITSLDQVSAKRLLFQQKLYKPSKKPLST